jgi:hypothetical protein
VAHIRPGSIENTLEFQACYDIRRLTVSIGIEIRRVESLAPGGEYYRTDIELSLPWLVVVADSTGQADFFTETAANASFPVDAVG